MRYQYTEEKMRAFLKAVISGKKVSDGNSLHSAYRRAYDQIFDEVRE